MSIERRLRQSILGLGAASAIGTMVELAILRHWGTPTRLIPWAALVLVFVAGALAATATSPAQMRTARAISVTTVLASLYGAWQHISSNYQIAPLQPQHSATWAARGTLSKVWESATGGVDPGAPTLAPFALVVAGACVWLSTMKDTNELAPETNTQSDTASSHVDPRRAPRSPAGVEPV